MNKKIIILFFLSFLMYGCSLSDLKTPYPEIQFYKLDHEPVTVEVENPIDVNLQFRNFTISSEYDTPNILAEYGESRIKKYFYHRWISEPAALVTDFFIERYSNSKVIKTIMPSVSFVPPQYIITGEILNFNGYNDQEDDDDSYSVVSVKINLIKRDEKTSEESIVFSKLYTAKSPRGDDDIESIPVALSKAASETADNSMTDVIAAITEILQNETYTNKEDN